MSKIDAKKMLGCSVKAWRNQRGFSQEELGGRADLHRTYISDVERGARNLSLESITRLAVALKISVSALFPQEFQKGKTGDAASNAHGKNLVDILLVEDDPNDVELTLHAFRQARFANRVNVVNDGAEALDYLFCRGEYSGRRPADHPQIVLLDLNLPKVSGLEVLQKIKADERTRMIPVMILTTSGDDHNIAECRRLGVEDYIIKPVNFQTFSRATPRLNLNWALIKPLEINANARNGRA
jgi:CheY-like chemotaxis protein/DNA-binding XRE family transcriptional regulator